MWLWREGKCSGMIHLSQSPVKTHLFLDFFWYLLQFWITTIFVLGERASTSKEAWSNIWRTFCCLETADIKRNKTMSKSFHFLEYDFHRWIAPQKGGGIMVSQLTKTWSKISSSAYGKTEMMRLQLLGSKPCKGPRRIIHCFVRINLSFRHIHHKNIWSENPMKNGISGLQGWTRAIPDFFSHPSLITKLGIQMPKASVVNTTVGVPTSKAKFSTKLRKSIQQLYPSFSIFSNALISRVDFASVVLPFLWSGRFFLRQNVTHISSPVSMTSTLNTNEQKEKCIHPRCSGWIKMD